MISKASVVTVSVVTQEEKQSLDIEMSGVCLVSVIKFETLCSLYWLKILIETWLNPSITTNYIQPPGYCTYERDRNRHNGRVLLFVRDRISSKHRSDLEHPELEVAWVEVQLSRSSCFVVIVCIYIPPGSQAAGTSILDNQLEQVINVNKEVVLVGI